MSEEKNQAEPQKQQYVIAQPYEYMPGVEEDEIDLIELAKTIWNGRIIIIKVTSLFIAIGFFVALGSSVEYSSDLKLLPENQQGSSLSGIGGLARQFGLSRGSEQIEGISPALYPEIAQSTELMVRLLEYEVNLPDGRKQVTLFEYFTEHQKVSIVNLAKRYTIELPLTVMGWIRNLLTTKDSETVMISPDDPKTSRLLRLSKDEWAVISSLKERISSSINIENGIVTVTAKMPNAMMAADVADQVVIYLSEYITNYRTEKTRSDVEFIEGRYIDAKVRFEDAQQKLAEFTDRQRNTVRATDDIQRQSLQSEYNFTFNLYTSLAERLEEARIKLQEDTPIVKIMEPAYVPDKRSEPKRGMIVIIYTLLGGIISTGWVLLTPVMQTFKRSFDN